jgi:PAS domain S-box-containing protein
MKTLLKSELLNQNEQLLKGIHVRQTSLTKLSNYLSELESQLALIFAASPDIIVFLDRHANIIKISDAALPILGYTREDLINKCLWDFIALSDLEHTKQHFACLRSSEFCYSGGDDALVNHWISKSGKFVKLVWRFSLYDGREDQTIGIASDITTFGVNEKHDIKVLQKAIDLSTDGVVVTDSQSKSNTIIYANEAFTKITGYTKEDLIGQNARFLQTEECKMSRALGTLRESIKTGKGCDVLLQNARKNGEIFYHRLMVSAVREGNTIINHIWISKDVTNDMGIKYEWSPNTERGFYPITT